MGIVGSFEYSINTQSQNNLYLRYYLRVQEYEDGTLDMGMRIYNTNGDWELKSFQVLSRADNWITPNQSEYLIELSLYAPTNQTYIRNVNLMLLVVDS